MSSSSYQVSIWWVGLSAIVASVSNIVLRAYLEEKESRRRFSSSHWKSKFVTEDSPPEKPLGKPQEPSLVHPTSSSSPDSDSSVLIDSVDDSIRRLRKAETVLSRRTDRVVLVIEAVCDMFNLQAIYRTAECLGIQHVHVIQPVMVKKHAALRKISRESTDFLTLHSYTTTHACIQALVTQGYVIWSTDLSQNAESLDELSFDDDSLELFPEKVAIVIGREADGVSLEMRQASHKCIYLPLHGFADSLNVNVATALVLQKILYLCPEAIGSLDPVTKVELRNKWFTKLAKNPAELRQYLEVPPEVLKDLRRPIAHRGAWQGKKVKNKILAKETVLKQES